MNDTQAKGNIGKVIQNKIVFNLDGAVKWVCVTIMLIVVISAGFLYSCRAPSQRVKTIKAPLPALSMESVVYVTDKGKRYHRKDCKYLNGSGSPMTKSEAEKGGLTPCAICKP